MDIPFKNAPTLNRTSNLKQTKPAMPTTQRPMENSFVHYNICKSNKHPSGFNHCGLDRKDCHTYRDARTRKFAANNDKIPQYTDKHFSHFFKAANQYPSDPLTSVPLNENMTSSVVGVIRTNDEIQPEASQATTRHRISINGT